MKSYSHTTCRLGLGLLIIWISAPGWAAHCATTARTNVSVQVYRDVPRYITGVGWSGNAIDSVPALTSVRICNETTVSFGFSSKVWAQIAYSASGRWKYGLVLEDNLTILRRATSNQRQNEPRLRWAVYTPATIKVTDSSGSEENGAELDPPSYSTPAGETASSAEWHDLLSLYWPLFVALLLGMMVKVLVDLLDNWQSRKKTVSEQIRNGLVAMLVSPVVFLGFLQTGQFGTETQTFIVLMLLAFQSGFFWQAILKRAQPG